jgi:glutaredoxin
MSFVVYTKTDCPYCTKIKKVLNLTKQTYVSYTLNVDFTKEEFYSEFGEGSTFPQVLCNEQKLGGCIDTIKYLQEQKLV